MPQKQHVSIETRRKISATLKAWWARKRMAAEHHNHKAANEEELPRLYEAAAVLVDYDALRKVLLYEITTDDFIHAVAQYHGAGTHLHKRLRTVLVEAITKALE
jgi:hypothetical protein